MFNINQNISFKVLPGQVVALVGQSGGGKSTVVKLIEHFYELSSGRILLGKSIMKYHVPNLESSWTLATCKLASL